MGFGEKPGDMGLCPIASPKGFPNVYGAHWRIALWKPSGINT